MSLREKIQERITQHREIMKSGINGFDKIGERIGASKIIELEWVLLELKKEEEIKHWTYCLDCKAKLAVMASN